MKEVTFVVERYDGSDSYLQEYIFACREGMTVLDALIEIKEKQDPSLNFTASCRSAICGSCAVRVNGNAVLACDTRLDDLLRRWSSNILTVGPLANFRVISDLVVDWDEKLSRLRAVCPGLIADEGFRAEWLPAIPGMLTWHMRCGIAIVRGLRLGMQQTCTGCGRFSGTIRVHGCAQICGRFPQ